ncbi:unnamed protein product [Rotaria sp. Silwood1]|nr:unnamed protein product [Rotaria sp. Silwood1]CAF4882164.1 unnamed protein product [Rotaria sp. Silwood1]
MDKLSKSVEVLKLLSTTTSQTLIIKCFMTICQITAFCSIAAHSEDIVHKKLLEYYELICRILGRLINDKEIKSKTSHGLFSKYVILWLVRFLMTNAINQLLEHQNQNASTHLIKRIIQLLRYSNLFDFDQLLI